MAPMLQAKAHHLIDTLNHRLGTQLNDIERYRFKAEAHELMDVDPADAHIALGIIASFEQNVEEMHRCHKLGITYSGEASYAIFNYANSLIKLKLHEEALYQAKTAFEKSVKGEEVHRDALEFIIGLCHILDLEDEFIDYAAEWELLTGKPHILMDSEEEDNEDAYDEALTDFENQVQNNRSSFIEVDASIFD